MSEPSLSELTHTFAKVGFLSFGGPAAQIALMHRIILDEKRWVGEADYLRALSFCMLLPGPEAMQLATWIGWRLHGVKGGLIAGGLFVLPGAFVVLGLSLIYAAFGQVPIIAALFTGVQAAVIAIVVEALLRVSKRALKSREAHVIAVAAFAGLFVFKLPFPLIILAAATWGFLRSPSGPQDNAAPEPPAVFAQSAKAAAIWLAVWLIPLGLLILTAPERLAEIGVFFSKLAVLTFGGAYAVLAWIDVYKRQALRHVHQRAGLLDHAERTDDRNRLVFPADREVDDRPLGLCAPVLVGGNLQRTKAVGFGTGRGHGGLLLALARPLALRADKINWHTLVYQDSAANAAAFRRGGSGRRWRAAGWPRPCCPCSPSDPAWRWFRAAGAGGGRR